MEPRWPAVGKGPEVLLPDEVGGANGRQKPYVCPHWLRAVVGIRQAHGRHLKQMGSCAVASEAEAMEGLGTSGSEGRWSRSPRTS